MLRSPCTAVQLGEKLTAKMPNGIVQQFIVEHPCLLGIASDTDVQWTGDSLNGAESATGYFGLLQGSHTSITS